MLRWLILLAQLCAGAALAQSSDPNPQPMPFTRDGVSYALPVTAQPQTYAIQQPPGAMSYRGANECAVDLGSVVA